MHLADALQMQVCKEFVWQKNILTKLAKWIPLWFRVVRKQNLKHSKGVNIFIGNVQTTKQKHTTYHKNNSYNENIDILFKLSALCKSIW